MDRWTRAEAWEALLPPAETVQLLAPDGRLRPHERFGGAPDSRVLLRMHELMVVARHVDRAAVNLQRQGQLALHLSSAGQEGAQVGAALAMAEHDWVFPQGRELPLAIARGLDPADLLHVWRGTWHAHHDPHEHRFAPMTIPIGTQALHAVGFGMGVRFDDGDTCVVCCFGDGATSSGDVHEALNFAGVFAAPVVFLVQNNGWAISVPLAGQTAAPSLAHKAIGYGMPGIRVDGNDVVACHAVSRWALEHARTGGGPVFVEAMTYRMAGHSTADDPTRYRPEGELETWAARDPIVRLERHLRTQGLLDDAGADAVAGRAEAAVAAVRSAIVDHPAPDPDELFAHVYADVPEHLARQRAQLRRERDSGPRR